MVLGTPDSGDYSGETDFLTSRRQLDPANLQRKTFGFCGPLRALLVMSDGVADDYFPAAPGMARLYADLVLNGVLPPAVAVGEEALAEVSEHTPPNFDPSQLDREAEAVTADGPRRVMLRSAAEYASELGRDVPRIAASPAFLAAGARNAAAGRCQSEAGRAVAPLARRLSGPRLFRRSDARRPPPRKGHLKWRRRRSKTDARSTTFPKSSAAAP